MKNLKKILAVILSILMVAAIPMTAFAAPGSGTPIGDENTQDEFVLDHMDFYTDPWNELGNWQEPLWDYDDKTYRYTDENGTTWRYMGHMNWIISNENPVWWYQILDDGTLYVTYDYNYFGAFYDNLSDVPADIINVKAPSTLDGMKVTRLDCVCADNTLTAIIPDSVIGIEYHAFRGNGNLKRVYIPKSVTYIDVEAFELTDNIELYYEGTEEEWNNIITWHMGSTSDEDYWAVTNFDWFGPMSSNDENNDTGVKAIHFNVAVEDFEPLEPEEKELTAFEKLAVFFANIAEAISNFFARILSFISF